VFGTISGTSIDEREQFRQLGLLVETIRQADPAGYVKVDIDPDTSRFRNFFICPSAAKLASEMGGNLQGVAALELLMTANQ
jgi:hypothetical protein